MKIMHMVLNLKIGGLENLVLDMARSQSKDENEVIICSLEPHRTFTREIGDESFRVVCMERKHGKDLKLLWNLRALLKDEKPDVVHTHNRVPLVYGTLSARLSGIKGVMNTRHGEEYLKRPAFIWNSNDFVVTISQSAKTNLLHCNRIRLDKVRTIYNGINTGRYKNVIKTYGGKRGKHIVGTVCRLDDYKDIPTLIMSYERIISMFPVAELWIVGDGPQRENLAQLVNSRKLQSKVKFLGWRNDIGEINRDIDVFVLPSLTEGVSIALLEAMTCGCPVVATNVGGNPEVVVDGVTGFLVPPKDPVRMADAVGRILSDPKLAQEMGEAGRRRVEEKFSLDRMVAEYDELYRECLTKKGIASSSPSGTPRNDKFAIRNTQYAIRKSL